MNSKVETPYALLALFKWIVLPLILLSAVILFALTIIEIGSSSEQVYIDLESQRMEQIFNHAIDEDPNFAKLFAGIAAGEEFDDQLFKTFEQTLKAETDPANDLCLNLLLPGSASIASVNNTPVCTDLSKSIANTLAANKTGRLLEDYPEKGAWTVVAPIRLNGATTHITAAITKLSARVERTITKSVVLWGLIAAAGMTVALFVTFRLFGKAQTKIDQQVVELVGLRNELAQYLSPATVRAVSSSNGRDIVSSRSDQTLLFLDIRDFSSFAETAQLDDVVTFIDRALSLSAQAVSEYGGDIDKVIGDGMLVTFEGDNRQSRALKAGIQILERVANEDFPRGIGIGIHDGEIISATIGRGARRDYTVLGRAVNQTARLCSMAKPGEIVVSAPALDAAENYRKLFGEPQSVHLKGHSSELRIYRYRVNTT